ncbi:MAG: hypothetical protein OK457_04080 [Thaumarchaeota archaeon]|nr:hypothetical protein [Nitrososphaerota archaeon]
MRPLEPREKTQLYKFTKTILIFLGAFLIIYGGWSIGAGLVQNPHDSQYWFGIFPAYVGAMMILISFAMRIEWFTDARRFW